MKRVLPSLFAAAGLIGVGSLALPTAAFAQASPNVDSDGDGVPDSVDAMPCDVRVSARVYAPADRTYGMLLFEDKWPDKGDYDFNDAVIAYNQTLLFDSSARLTGLRLELSVLAVGARFANGLAIRLPNTPRSSVTDLTFTVTNAATSDIRLDGAASEATIILADDLHALAGADAPREWVNTDPNLPRTPLVGMVIDVALDPGAALSAADAPFDIYLFNAIRGTEVHLPRYAGTANLNTALFNTRDDGSTPGRYFVTQQGVPFALDLPELANYPQEGEAIDNLYPEIVAYGASSGTQATTFYRNPVTSSAFGLTQPHALLGAAAADQSCFAPDPGVCGSATNGGSVGAPATNLCGFGTASSVSSSGGLWRWTCAGNYSSPTACTATDWACQPNISQSCAVSGGTGTQMCNGSGTGYGSCTVTSCNSGFYQSGNSCIAQVCTPGSTRSCAITNGTGNQTCDNLGASYGGCNLLNCNSGYTQSGNSCQAAAANGLVPGNTTNVINRNGYKAQCQKWSGDECLRMYIAFPQSAFVTEAPCGVPDKTSLRPVWHGSTADQCRHICWIATGDSTCVAHRTSADSGTAVGWMYGSPGYSVRCDTSGRQYSSVSVPGVSTLTWSFDSMNWQRNGTFSGYRCNW